RPTRARRTASAHQELRSTGTPRPSDGPTTETYAHLEEHSRDPLVAISMGHLLARRALRQGGTGNSPRPCGRSTQGRVQRARYRLLVEDAAGPLVHEVRRGAPQHDRRGLHALALVV